eukprot:6039280-Amphidinium_carterae.1
MRTHAKVGAPSARLQQRVSDSLWHFLSHPNTEQAVLDFVVFLKNVGATASWPPDLREMLYLQLPKEGAKNAGERRPIALLPQLYRLWSACCRADVLTCQLGDNCVKIGERP